MFGKNAIGIFLGAQGLGLVESTNRGKVKNYFYKPYPKDITKPSGVVAPRDNIFKVFLDNEIEIIAFLQRSIRESRISLENSEIVICVPNRDLIIRFFEIPPIPRKDISASIGFEIKKYIPFRTEEITYDYQTRSKKNIIEVLFAGIKNEDSQKYNSILTQLKINVSAIEPSQFSLFRLLKIKKIISDKESVVVVELEQEEGIISIIDNGIPCFSRDIKVSSGPESESSDINMEAISFRMVNEIRVSIDYFRRQFLKKGIDRIIVLSKQESKELINIFNKELGVSVQHQSPNDIFGTKEEHSLDLAKALGASFRVSKPSSLLINLGKKQKAASVALLSSAQIISESLEQILDIPKPIIIQTLSFALVAFLVVFIVGNFGMKPINQKLGSITKEANSILIGDLKGLEIGTLKSFKKKTSDKIAIYKRVFKKEFLISEKLEVLPGLIPEGVWLEEISFNRDNNSLYMKGLVYSEDDKEATEAPYDFISNLKNSALFFNKVSNISLRSLKSAVQNNYKVLKFELDIKLST